jgi:hypothetical protein
VATTQANMYRQKEENVKRHKRAHSFILQHERKQKTSIVWTTIIQNKEGRRCMHIDNNNNNSNSNSNVENFLTIM